MLPKKHNHQERWKLDFGLHTLAQHVDSIFYSSRFMPVRLPLYTVVDPLNAEKSTRATNILSTMHKISADSVHDFGSGNSIWLLLNYRVLLELNGRPMDKVYRMKK